VTERRQSVVIYAVTISRRGEKEPLYQGEHIFLAGTHPDEVVKLEFARAIAELGYEGGISELERDFNIRVARLNGRLDYPPLSAYRHCPACGRNAKELGLDNRDFKVCVFCGKPTHYPMFELVRFCEHCQVTARSHGLTNEEFMFCGECGNDTSFAILKWGGER